jgi:hypothetical protein
LMPAKQPNRSHIPNLFKASPLSESPTGYPYHS